MRKIFLFCFILFYLLPSLAAQEMQVPRFFAANERLERPDLSRLPRLRFLTTVDFPPFNYLDKSGNLVGYHIDLVRAICLELKLVERCQIEAVEWEQLTPRLKQGTAEAIIAGLAVTSQMRADFAFTRSYMRFPARFITSGDGAAALKMLSDGNVAVGIVKNTAHEKMFSAYFPTIQKQIFDDDEAFTRALQEKRLALAFGDGMRLSRWLASQDSRGCCQFVGDAYYGVAYLGQGLRLMTRRENVPLTDAPLTDAFDYALNILEQRGKLTELYLRYFPVSFY